MSALGDQVAAWCRTQAGAPWIHQGRVPRSDDCSGGMDCVGLPVLAARACGREIEDFLAYSEFPTAPQLLDYVSKNCSRVIDDGEPGDLLLVWIRRPDEPRHALIDVGHDQVAHAKRWHGGGAVTIEAAARWLDRLHSRWRLEGRG